MKKLLFPVLTFLLISNSFAWAEPVRNFVTEMNGKATLVRAGQEQPVSVGMEVQPGDRVNVQSGTMDVSFNSYYGMRFLEATQCMISAADSENTQVNLITGNMIANLKKKLTPGQKFEVETPTAVLAVRGTQFWGQVLAPESGPAKTTFAVREGVLSITAKASQKSFTVEAGKAIELPEGEGNPSVRDATEGELDAIKQAEVIKTEQ